MDRDIPLTRRLKKVVPPVEISVQPYLSTVFYDDKGEEAWVEFTNLIILREQIVGPTIHTLLVKQT